MLKLLIIKTSSLGDVVHNLPIIADIKQHYPDAEIDWVVEESFADIPKLHPAVNHVFPVAIRRWRKHLFSKKTWAEIATFKKTMKQNQYDAIIDTQGLLKSALIARCANGVKHGYDSASIREPLASRFYDKTYTISYQQNAVTRNRTLATLSLGYTPPTNAPDYGIAIKNNASASRIDIGFLDNYIIALHGTSRDSKLWPISHWVALGKLLGEKNLNLVLPWASDAELSRANEIAGNLNNAKVLPKLSIAQLANIICHAQAAIGVDTGLSHLAAALNIPTIAIYTDTNPALTGVVAGSHAPAINLGGVSKIPSVEQVIQTFNHL